MNPKTVNQVLAQISALTIDDSLPVSRILSIAADFGQLVSLDDKIEVLESVFQRFEDQIDWERFVWFRRFDDGTRTIPELHQRWLNVHQDPFSELDQRIQEPVQSFGARPPQILSKERESTRKVESLFLQNIDAFLESILEHFEERQVHDHFLDSFLPLQALPSHLRHNSEKSYNHSLHRLVKAMLDEGGPALRGHQSTLTLCGTAIGILYPEEDIADVSHAFRELELRLANCLESDETSPALWLWTAELALCKENYRGAFICALEFWKSYSFNHLETNLQVLNFFFDCSGDDPEWSEHVSRPEINAEFHVFHLEYNWCEKEETLLSAFVRRAVANSGWNTEFLATLFHVWTFGIPPEYDSSLLPTECWIWLAENDLDVFIRMNEYYYFWNAAFESSQNSQSTCSILSCVVLLSGIIFDAIDFPTTSLLPAVLSRLEQHSRNPKWKLRVEELAEVAATFLQPDNAESKLKTSERVEISNFAERIGIPPESLNRRLNQRERRAATQYRQVHCQRNLERTVGEDIWNQLDKSTQEAFLDGEHSYQSKWGVDGDLNFADCFQSFSNALLLEINSRLWRHVWIDGRAKTEMKSANSQLRSQIEWSDFNRILRDFQNYHHLNRVAAMHGVCTDILAEHLTDFDWILKECRNNPAHLGIIDRESATMMYDRLFRKGTIRRILGALHGLRPLSNENPDR